MPLPSLKGVQAGFRTAKSGTKAVEFRKVEDKPARSGAQMISLMIVVTEEGEDKGVIINENFVYQNADGQVNQAGLSRFKQMVLETLGEEAAEDENFDHERLLNWQGMAEIQLTSYDKKDGNGQQEYNADGTKVTVPTNRIKRYFRNS